MNFTNNFYFLKKLNITPLSFEDLKILNNWEQKKGAKNPVRKTSAKIFWALEINRKKLLSEKFFIQTCKKYIVPHKKLPKAQIKPYLKCPIKISLFILILPNQTPQKIKPGIWVKLLSRVIESKIKPKNKPNINPLIDPLIIDHGNNQNNGQYGWIPSNPSQPGCHKKIIGIKIKKIIDNFFVKKIFIKFLLLKFEPNLLDEVLLKVIFLPFFVLSMTPLQIEQSQ